VFVGFFFWGGGIAHTWAAAAPAPATPDYVPAEIQSSKNIMQSEISKYIYMQSWETAVKRNGNRHS